MSSQKNILILHGDTKLGEAAFQAASRRGLQVYVVGANCAEMRFDEHFFSLDTANESEVHSLLDELRRRNIFIDYLLTSPLYHSLHQLRDLSRDQVINYNLKASTLFCHTFGTKMLHRGEGRIIQVANNIALDSHNPKHISQLELPPLILEAYLSSMAGLWALTRQLSAQYGKQNVLVNSLMYGPIAGLESSSLVQAYQERVPLHRAMKLQDFTNALDLFLDPQSSYITGQNLLTDGGVAIW